MCARRSDQRALTLEGAGDCEITATAAGSDDYNEATVGYTVTVQAAGALVLTLDAIATDDIINIAEKAAGFEIGGDTGTEAGVGVTVEIGGETLTTTSADDAGTATWTVSVLQTRRTSAVQAWLSRSTPRRPATARPPRSRAAWRWT